MTTPPPLLVRINRKRAMGLGVFLAGFGALVVLMALALLWQVPDEPWLALVALASGGLFAVIGLFNLGLAMRDPVALRLDATGVSGYYPDPATWDEIKDVKYIKGQKGQAFVGFELHDPVTFRDRQTPWRRYLSWTNGRHKGAHLIVPQALLSGTTAKELAKEARRFHPHLSQ